MNIEKLIAILILLMALGGGYFFLKEEYERQLQTTENKALALLKALNEYIVKDLGLTIVRLIIFVPLIIFVIGGVIGLLLLGWDWLLGQLS